MDHEPHVWSLPKYEHQKLDELRMWWLEWLGARPQPASPATIRKYDESLRSFMASLRYNDKPLTLASLTPAAVNKWVTDQRAGRLPDPRPGERQGVKCKDATIGSRHAALRAFSRRFIWKELELTKEDLLARVQRFEVEPEPKQGLTSEQLKALLDDAFDDRCYEQCRDKAFFYMVASTGLRFRSVLELEMQDVSDQGEVFVTLKGGRKGMTRLAHNGRKALLRYLQRRPQPAEGCPDRIFLTETGTPLSYMGGQMVIRRLKKRSGQEKLNWHLLRHSFAQHAFRMGASVADVQGMLHHRSPQMAIRYGGWARAEQAAKLTTKYSPV